MYTYIYVYVYSYTLYGIIYMYIHMYIHIHYKHVRMYTCACCMSCLIRSTDITGAIDQRLLQNIRGATRSTDCCKTFGGSLGGSLTFLPGAEHSGAHILACCKTFGGSLDQRRTSRPPTRSLALNIRGPVDCHVLGARQMMCT